MNFIPGFFDKKGGRSRILHDEISAPEKLAFELKSKMAGLSTNRPIVFVCIGTDRSTGDSLGPLVGTLLEEKAVSPFFVYGTLENPIHAVNLKDQLSDIHEKHTDPFIIGIDACLGRLKSVGVIQVSDGPVKPGAGVNKDLPEVGDIHITGIVNVSGFMEFFVLQNTRLNLVLKMAKTIANGIHEASTLHHRQDLWWEQIGQEKTT
ncbi:MAG: sporulation protein YyaC [Bacillus sp. (in: firmicutes)]|jgi:putative sporulation protein YyaC|uniref:spore protease YyaC n=1 Tax=Bacillus sp. 1NLA3E TaxID=666686 RepID=UPI000247ED3A|nr:spore protease YyaC [Bacillus sp. 1NLA3E]AGK56182.1 sporulation protein YyaC [Bacillus sp. 1NLA3E]MDF2902792.1 sporulation protein YyaC [Bacillus sp. (in: firmicutes)]